MFNILNYFSNENTNTNTNKVVNNPPSESMNRTHLKQTQPIYFSPSLEQGYYFKNHKVQKNNKSSYKLNLDNSRMREGFTNQNVQQLRINQEQGSLTDETNEIIQQNDYMNDQGKLSILKKLYDNTIEQYELLTKQISENINGHVDRVSQENPYLNKVVQFKTGEICYVTKQGVVKPIPSKDIWESLNISQDVQVNLDIPWSRQYNIPKVPIQTTPPLISGTPVKKGQSLGNEGSNVFVNQLLPSNVEPTYMGCYATNEENNNMTFLGSSPPPLDVTIENGNFAQPVLDNDTFKYITSASEVPGWYFGNTVLLNNSNAWGFIMPYARGNQCVSIQRTSYIYTTITLNTGVDYTISFSACARNCCMDENTGNPIELKLHTNLDAFISSIDTITPSPINTWVDYNITFTVPTTQTYRLYFSGTYDAGDQSTAIANVQLTSKTGDSTELYTYEDCKQSAIMSGYQFFGLQNVNFNTGKGYCAASNSQPAVTKFGESKVVSKKIELWSSGTSGVGNTAIFINNTLQVINVDGANIYSTTVPESTKTEPNPFVGCYSFRGIKEKDIPQLGNPWDYTMHSCIDEATKQGYKYVGIGGPHRDSTNKDNDQTRRCLVFNDLNSAQMKGKSNTCNNPYGANRVAAIYETTNLEYSNGNSYLILQNDGNLVIYPGSSPKDRQGKALWASGTNKKQKSSNPNMTADKGKYGKNWISNGATLAPDEFIGSNDGSIALVMQADGNLVLYTFELETNCQKMSDGNMGAGVGGNAVYDIGMKSFQKNMGRLAYIDDNSELYTYPKNNQEYTNTYTTVKNANTPDNNISGASFNGATLESCQNACNDNKECAGFVLDGDNCYPKTNQMYPYGGKYSSKSGSNIYIRNKQPSKPPLGVSLNTNGVDSVMYQNYMNKGDVGSEYGLASVNSVQKQQLDDLQGRIQQISREINKYTGEFSSGTNSANQQLSKNSDGANQYIKDLSNINQQIQHMKTGNNINNILEDSDIVVLQKNYNYLFWSVLAAGTLLVTMSVAKK
jgi:hypothetical protein